VHLCVQSSCPCTRCRRPLVSPPPVSTARFLSTPPVPGLHPLPPPPCIRATTSTVGWCWTVSPAWPTSPPQMPPRRHGTRRYVYHRPWGVPKSILHSPGPIRSTQEDLFDRHKEVIQAPSTPQRVPNSRLQPKGRRLTSKTPRWLQSQHREGTVQGGDAVQIEEPNHL
jgi:hypothetical protein